MVFKLFEGEDNLFKLAILTFQAPTHKMVKHAQKIRRQKPTNCLSVYDHFVGLALKGCVRCIFANLFLKSKTQHLWNFEKGLIFHLKGSFRTWENQILEF